MILLGRLVTNDEITRIGEQARVTLAAVSGGVPGLRANSTHELLVEHNAATEVVRAFDDIEGSPVLTLRIESPARSLRADGKLLRMRRSSSLARARSCLSSSSRC